MSRFSAFVRAGDRVIGAGAKTRRGAQEHAEALARFCALLRIMRTREPNVLRCGLMLVEGGLRMMRVLLLKNHDPAASGGRASCARHGRMTRGAAAAAPLVRELVFFFVLRNARLSRVPHRFRYLGKSGRSNTPWHTSCENSVQGGILQ